MGFQLIEVWGMRCVKYDRGFEKHLSTSFKTIPSASSLSKKRKAPTDDGDGSADKHGGSAKDRGRSRSVIVLTDDSDEDGR